MEQTVDQKIAALEKAYKDEVDSRSRNTIAYQIKKLKAEAATAVKEDSTLRLQQLSGIITESQVQEYKAKRDSEK